MSKSGIPEKMIFAQLEEALEERQTPDRRQKQQDLPKGVAADRRKGDRRARAKKS